SDRLSNNAVFLCLSQAFASLIAGHTRHRAGTVPTRWRVTTAYCVSADNAETDISNTFAPEGASRCRALTSGLQDRAAGRKEEPFRRTAAVKRPVAAKVKESCSGRGQVCALLPPAQALAASRLFCVNRA